MKQVIIDSIFNDVTQIPDWLRDLLSEHGDVDCQHVDRIVNYHVICTTDEIRDSEGEFQGSQEVFLVIVVGEVQERGVR